MNSTLSLSSRLFYYHCLPLYLLCFCLVFSNCLAVGHTTARRYSSSHEPFHCTSRSLFFLESVGSWHRFIAATPPIHISFSKPWYDCCHPSKACCVSPFLVSSLFFFLWFLRLNPYFLHPYYISLCSCVLFNNIGYRSSFICSCKLIRTLLYFVLFSVTQCQTWIVDPVVLINHGVDGWADYLKTIHCIHNIPIDLSLILVLCQSCLQIQLI